jgi:hypothetical protein
MKAFIGVAVFPFHACRVDSVVRAAQYVPTLAQGVNDGVKQLPPNERAIYVEYGKFFLRSHSHVIQYYAKPSNNQLSTVNVQQTTNTQQSTLKAGC